ncbi:hypothetical protein R6Q59_024873 [Mikania micrantha]|uniref:GATA transcription factor n=1 Tax=Mikania micrantha TaxID=192012 RepID=A0A5N6PB25_9ASTR|nr:hypothetical protein E3N88_09945 [Mikania micrantha]
MEEPSFFTGDYSGTGECSSGHHKITDNMNIYNNNQFLIDDLLVDFPNHDDVVLNDAFFDNVIGNSADSSTVTAVDSCNSSVAGSEALFTGNYSESRFSGVELCLPYDDISELEWLSSFTQESFSIVDVQNLHIISGEKKSPATDSSSSGSTPGFRQKPAVPCRINSQIFQTDVFVPGKARSKRSRTAPYDWTSRILHLKQSLSSVIKSKPHKSVRLKKRDEGFITRCLHCGCDKTPQWRTGPKGPKTLCNACGVRYKSGRLVPEYRPAASPTFVSTKHSNSHRKVMEIRRQKELRNAHKEFVDRSSGLPESNSGDDCLVDRQCGAGYMHMI